MKKILMIILDGFGYRKETHGNAIIEANMENFNNIFNTYPHSILNASGESVGLPENIFGNSEVCHEAIGIGKKVKQDITIATESINEKITVNNADFIKMINHVKENNSTLHLIGLLSDGGVHSHINYMKNLIPILKEKKLEKVIFHAITDGRDTSPYEAINFISEMDALLKDNNLGFVGTVCGRFYAMDRDEKWERTRIYADLILNNKGLKILNYGTAIKNCYNKGLTDEFLPPLILNDKSQINEHDAICWLNFRTDRARQILKVLTEADFNIFPIKQINNVLTTTLFPVPEINAPHFFNSDETDTYSLGEYFSDLNLTQARIAESEKYNHVTYFFNAGKSKKFKNCDNFLIPSPKVMSYDEIPEMSLAEVVKQTKKSLAKDYDFILVNIANPDMIGHTGNYKACLEALSHVDNAIKEMVECANDNFYKVIITADHGNIDTMLTEDNKPIRTHSHEAVPFIILDEKIELKEKGDITMIAPTLLKYMDIAIPKEMKDTKDLILESE